MNGCSRTDRRTAPTGPARTGLFRHAARRLAAVAGLVMALVAAGARAANNPERETLVAVFPDGFPPVYQLTRNNVPIGFGIELMEEIAARARLHIVYRPVRSWEEAHAAMREGRADLIPNMGITPERAERYDFSLPLTRSDVSAYVRADTRDVTDIGGLIARGRIIATVRTHVAVDLLGDRPGARLKTYDTLSEAFFALHTGAVDALVYTDAAIEHFALQLELADRIRRIGKPLAVIERAVAVRKGNTALLDRLNPEIELLVGSPRFQAIHDRWYGAALPFWTSGRVVGLAATLLFLALAVGMYARIRVLRRAGAFTNAVLDTAVEGILTLDAGSRVRSANPAAERILARSRQELLGRELHELIVEIDGEELIRHLHQLKPGAAAGTPAGRDCMGRRPDGELVPLRLGIARTSVRGELLYVCTVHDLTEQRRAEREAEYLADHDPVTGLLNQRGILLVLSTLVELARRNQRPLACLNVGIERFVQINEMYGRQAGDTILVRFGEFLRGTVRAADLVARDSETMVARLGGNRFLIVLPETSADGAHAVASKLLAGLPALTHEVGDETLRLTGKIGITCFPEHGASAEELVSRAEITLRQAQEHPLDAILVFSPQLAEQETRAHRNLQRLHLAIEEQRLILHFQPVLHIADNCVRHYEALVRMQGTDGSLIAPGEFIPVAEKSGLITRIDYRVLELAFSHLAGLETAGRDISLAVNISGEHLGDDMLFRWLTRNFEEGGVMPGRLLFEITETTAVRNLMRARSFMEALNSLGCRFALDDFGVGFTTFAHLRSLPVDMIKIDGSFVRDLPTNPENRALVRAMTDAAHSLGKVVTGEYTESAAVLEVLRELGVDYAQGYHIGRPGPDLTAAARPETPA